MGAASFRLTQKLFSLLLTLAFLAVLVAGVQAGLLYYIGTKRIPARTAARVTTELAARAKDSTVASHARERRAQIAAFVAQSVKRDAGGMLAANPPVSHELVSIGQFRDSNENPIERYNCTVTYALESNLLWRWPLKRPFHFQCQVVAKPNSGLQYLVTTPTGMP